MNRTIRLVTLIFAMVLAAGVVSCSRPLAGDTAEPADSKVKATVETPRRETLERHTRLAANVQAYREVPLYTKVTGYVKHISADIGDRVTKGQTLATLDIPEMQQEYAQAKSALREREAELAKARAEAHLRAVALRRSRALREKEAITEQALDEAKAFNTTAQAQVRVARARYQKARERLAELRALASYAVIKAPFDGIVTQRFVDEGTLVRPGTSGGQASPLVTVAQISTVRVFVDVPEPEVPLIDLGDKATLVVRALPRKAFTGSITRFAGALDEMSRTMRVEVDLDNQDRILMPGMFGTLTIVLETRTNALTVPKQAIHRGKEGSFVYTVTDGQARKVAVQTGTETNGRVEVLRGVDSNSRVVVSSDGRLRDGLALEVIESSGERS